MPIGDYLKQAAAQLRRAALARRDETQDLRRLITTREQETSRTVNELRNAISRLQVDVRSNPDPHIAGQMANEVAALEQQIRDTQANLEREKQRINQEIRWKEDQYGNLNQQAVDFERQASAGGL